MNNKFLFSIIISSSVLIFFLLVLPIFDKTRMLKGAIEQREIMLAELQSISNRVKELSSGIETNENNISKLDQLLPKQKEVSEILISIESITSASGLLLSEISLSESIGEGVNKINVNLKLSGNFDSLMTFFDLLEKKGFIIEKKKVSENSLYSNLRFNRIIVRFEAIFKNAKGSLKEYETIGGNFITIYTLTPEELIKEKVNAYLKRLKIRDLYDIFFLLRYVQDISLVKKELQDLITKFRKPADEKELKILIHDGLIPKTDQMILYIKNKL